MPRMPLKVGLPLLALLLLGLGLAEGRDKLLLILLGMGVALWTALSLPHPGPKAPPPGPVEQSLEEAGDDRDAADAGPDEPEGTPTDDDRRPLN